ncbi:hypothetical protein TNCV_4251841 [Trichonephila clavipes]|nr:hypothetical protein TNCV_4251841 [Trichonephila clavipes]
MSSGRSLALINLGVQGGIQGDSHMLMVGTGAAVAVSPPRAKTSAAIHRDVCPDYQVSVVMVDLGHWWRVPGSLLVEVWQESLIRLNRGTSGKRTVTHRSMPQSL